MKYTLPTDTIICGDAAETLAGLASTCVALTVTSPPYFRHRDYGVASQLGQENNLADYLLRLSQVLAQLHRVTTESGSCFFVIGDTYERGKLLLVPHRLALLADEIGWT